MRQHHETDNHSEQLIAFLEGGDARNLLAASPLADCELCRAELDELICLQGDLDEMGALERSVLGEAAALQSHLPSGHVREMLEQDPPIAPMRWPLYLLGAAAALWLLFKVPNLLPQDPGGLGPILGQQSEQLVSPTQDGEAWTQFRWLAHSAPGATYQVFVYADANLTQEVARSGIIGPTCVWEPTPDQLPSDAGVPIWWAVEVSPDSAQAPTETWVRGPIKR